MKWIIPILVLGLAASACSRDEKASDTGTSSSRQSAPAKMGTSGKEDGSNSGPSTPAALSEAQKANELIKFYNQTLDAFQNGAAPSGDLQRVAAQMKAHNATLSPSSFSATHLALVEQSLDGILAREDVDRLKADLVTFFETAKKYLENRKDYDTYYHEKEYTKDNWAKGDALAQQNARLAAQLQDNMKKVMNVLQPAAQRAETKLQQGNVLKDYAMTAQTFLKEAQAALVPVESGFVQNDVSKAAYTAMEKSLERAKALPTPRDTVAATRYNHFIEAGENFLAELRSVHDRVHNRQPDAQTQRKIMDSLQKSYGNLVMLYNQFAEK